MVVSSLLLLRAGASNELENENKLHRLKIWPTKSFCFFYQTNINYWNLVWSLGICWHGIFMAEKLEIDWFNRETLPNCQKGQFQYLIRLVSRRDYHPVLLLFCLCYLILLRNFFGRIKSGIMHFCETADPTGFWFWQFYDFMKLQFI